MLDKEDLDTLAARQILSDMRATIRALDPDMFEFPAPDAVAFPFDEVA